MTKVEPWVQQLCKDVVGKSKMKVGAVLKHPDGYKVKIVSGQYWGTYGLSNHWDWRRVKKDGTLSKKIYSGYGW